MFNVSTFYQFVGPGHQILDDLLQVTNRIKLLASAVHQMRRVFRELRSNEHKSEVNESRDSITEYVSTQQNALFTKAGTEADLYDVRKKFDEN